MLRSMTGFGMGDAESDSYRFHVEVKAVNQRYLDIDVKLPYALNRFDDSIKKTVKKFAARGKLVVGVTYQDKREKERKVTADTGLALAYKRSLDEISAALGLPPVTDVRAIASYPAVLTVEELTDAMEGAQEVLLAAVTEAMKNFVAMREAEGANIKADFLARLDVLADAVNRLEELAPAMVEHYRQRVTKTLAELVSAEAIDATRLVQEVGLYADHIDYTEEMVRLRSHFAQFRQIIESDEPVGRKLDFLIQEMNREINTATSKGPDVGVSEIAVAVKSEIEKLREQVQNIE